MRKVDPRIDLMREVLNGLFRQRKISRAEVERRMGRAKGYLYRGFSGFQGLSLDNLLLALDAAEIPFERFCERLYRETHQEAGGGLAIIPIVDVQKVVNETLAAFGHQLPEPPKPVKRGRRKAKGKPKS